MVKLKNLSCTKIIVHGRTLLKSVSAVGFTEKPSFLESVSFHGEMFCVTNFWLVLVICIVIAMIFIKKNIDKLVQDQFLQPVKDHPYDKFGLFFFQTSKNKIYFSKIRKRAFERSKNTLERTFLDFDHLI